MHEFMCPCGKKMKIEFENGIQVYKHEDTGNYCPKLNVFDVSVNDLQKYEMLQLLNNFDVDCFFKNTLPALTVECGVYCLIFNGEKMYEQIQARVPKVNDIICLFLYNGSARELFYKYLHNAFCRDEQMKTKAMVMILLLALKYPMVKVDNISKMPLHDSMFQNATPTSKVQYLIFHELAKLFGNNIYTYIYYIIAEYIFLYHKKTAEQIDKVRQVRGSKNTQQTIIGFIDSDILFKWCRKPYIAKSETKYYVPDDVNLLFHDIANKYAKLFGVSEQNEISDAFASEARTAEIKTTAKACACVIEDAIKMLNQSLSSYNMYNTTAQNTQLNMQLNKISQEWNTIAANVLFNGNGKK